MATLEQNIAKIRGTATKGTDVREAIASAIEQTDERVDNQVQSIIGVIETNSVFMKTTKISGTTDDYLLEITNHS